MTDAVTKDTINKGMLDNELEESCKIPTVVETQYFAFYLQRDRIHQLRCNKGLLQVQAKSILTTETVSFIFMERIHHDR